MAAVSASLEIPADLPRVWGLYFDPDRWAAWVDQFASIVELDSSYPERGSSLVWRSGRAGRGQVSEQVVEHDPQRRHRIEFSDPATKGTMTSTFVSTDRGTGVTLDLDYQLTSAGFFARLSDVLFVRSQMRASLTRSLEGLRAEVVGA